MRQPRGPPHAIRGTRGADIALPRRLADPARLILLAPVIFAAHVAEEAPRFVPYFNRLVEPDISQPLFLRVNAAGMAITLAVTAWLAWAGRAAAAGDDEAGTAGETGAAMVALAWLGFLMFANGIFHIVASVMHGYSPGTVTAAVVYLPFFALFARQVRRKYQLSPAVLATIALAGGIPMFVHGYLIAFRGSRLF